MGLVCEKYLCVKHWGGLQDSGHFVDLNIDRCPFAKEICSLEYEPLVENNKVHNLFKDVRLTLVCFCWCCCFWCVFSKLQIAILNLLCDMKVYCVALDWKRYLVGGSELLKSAQSKDFFCSFGLSPQFSDFVFQFVLCSHASKMYRFMCIKSDSGPVY